MTTAERQLVGRTAKVTISDPWDLVTQLGDAVQRITIVGVHAFGDGADTELVLAELIHPISWRGKDYQFLVLGPRRGPGLLQELSLGARVECNVVGAAADVAAGGSPWNWYSWRGGLRAIASLTLESS